MLLKPVFNSYFVVFARDTEVDGTQKIVYTIWHYGVPTDTLIYKCGYWIAVRGISTSVEPVPGKSYSIDGFWINNPWPPVPSSSNPSAAPPPPHSATDGCGTGGNRGIANEYVVYNDTWKDTYFTGCDVWHVGHSQYVNVCDPSYPKLGELVMKRDEFWSRGDRLVTPDEATRFVMRGIEEHELLQNEEFAQAIKGASPTYPLLVQRLDLPDTFYYLVAMRKNNSITSLISVDGLYGNLEGDMYWTNRPLRCLYAAKR
jgi:hypothetical protein